MTKTIVGLLKKGDLFTLNPIEEPKEKQVWVRGDYNRSTKRYECYKFYDINHFHDFAGTKNVYTDFYF